MSVVSKVVDESSLMKARIRERFKKRIFAANRNGGGKRRGKANEAVGNTIRRRGLVSAAGCMRR